MERRSAVCEKSCASAMIISRQSQEHEAPGFAGMKLLVVENMISGDVNSIKLPDTTDPDSDLVIVFTSGSTGTPKGIPISNRGILTCQSNLDSSMYASPGRRIAQFMSPAFDFCNVEIFSAFLHGATLVLRDAQDPYAHLSKSNAVGATPSALAAMDADELSNIDVVSPVANLSPRFADFCCLSRSSQPARR
jgi:non-ribosomal peptide synthetase component F